MSSPDCCNLKINPHVNPITGRKFTSKSEKNQYIIKCNNDFLRNRIPFDDKTVDNIAFKIPLIATVKSPKRAAAAQRSKSPAPLRIQSPVRRVQKSKSPVHRVVNKVDKSLKVADLKNLLKNIMS